MGCKDDEAETLATRRSQRRRTKSGQEKAKENNKHKTSVKNVNSHQTSEKTKRKRTRRKRRRTTRHQDPPESTEETGVPWHKDFGDSFGEKPPGVARLIGGNIDSFHAVNFNNSKAQELKQFLRSMDADGFWGSEGGVNWDLLPRSGRLEELFRTENALRSVTAHNKHERHGRRQWGGTFAMAFGELAMRAADCGVDPTGLGRWSWIRFEGRNGQVTRIISAYQPCNSSRKRLSTVYSQHRRYFERLGDFTCPRKAMVRDLGQALREWRTEGEKLLLFIDANEDLTSGEMDKMLSDTDLEMQDTVRTRHPHLPKTGTTKRGDKIGSVPVDGAYATPDLPVLKAGLISVKRTPSDHRFPVLEFDWRVLLGENVLRIVRPPARRLTSRIPSSVTRYNKRLTKNSLKHRLMRKRETVYHRSTTSLTPEQEATMESTDRVMSELMTNAGKKCRNLAMGLVDYTPQNSRARKIKTLWEDIVKKKSGVKKSSSKIKRMARSLGVHTPLSCTLAQAKRHKQAAVREFLKQKKSAPADRLTWQRRRACDYSPGVTEKDRKRAERQIQDELQRQAHRHLARVTGKTRHGAVDRVHVKNGNETIEYTDKETVEREISKANEARFQLAWDSPPLQEPLISDLGLLGDTEAAERILNGTYVCPPGTDEYTRKFIEALQATFATLPEDGVKVTVSREDFQRYWKRIREWTSSSISGLHFGHYKAAAQSNYLSELHALFTEISMTTGYSPSRWKKGLQVMLLKLEEVYLPEKLRAILLMEADFNFPNKLIFGSRMMDWAEANDEIPVEIWGSRKNHQAIDVALNRGLTMDLARQKRRSATVTSADAAYCYDRVAHNIAALGCRRLTVPKEATTTMFKTIQDMQMYLRTAFGDSDEAYGGDPDRPFQGVCQGNGGGPALWNGDTIVIVKMMRKDGHVCIIVQAISGGKIIFTGCLFVDDTDLVQFGLYSGEPLINLLNRSQATLDCWQGGLRATGGSLRLDKCNWGLAQFVFEKGKFRYATNEECPASLTIETENGVRSEIKRLEPHEAVKVVGVWQAVDGNMDKQFEVLQEKIDDLGRGFQKEWVPRRLAWTGLRTRIWPSLRYSLPATTFDKKQSDKLSSRLFRQVLPTLGANRHLPLVYRHGPLSLQGLDTPDVDSSQGIGKIERLLFHGDTGSLTGQLFEASLEQAQLELGISIPILESSFEHLGFLCTNGNVKTLWEFVSRNFITVRKRGFPVPPLLRTGDEFIMDRLLRMCDGWTDKQVLSFNRCRTKMQALTLADVIQGDGIRLRRGAMAWSPRWDQFSSKYDWAYEEPDAKDWTEWRRGLRLITSENLSLSIFDRLGHWINEPHKKWEFFYCYESRTVYRSVMNTWWRYKPRHGLDTRHPSEVELHDISSVPPPDTAMRATARFNAFGRPVLGGWAPSAPANPTIHHSIKSLIRSWQDSWSLDISIFPDNGAAIAKAIKNGDAIGVSDGSYMKERRLDLGTAAWGLSTRALIKSDACRGVVQTTGTENEVFAYRSELQGIHTIMMALLAICTFHNITDGYVEVGCDNDKGLDLSAAPSLQVALNRKHADILRAIRKLRKRLPIKVKFVHVDGHKDKHMRYQDLNPFEKLNVQMDTEAKRYLRFLIDRGAPPCQHLLMEEGWYCSLDGIKTTTGPADQIRHYIYSRLLREHLHSKNRLHRDYFELIDWRAAGAAGKTAPPLFRLWITKHVSGWCATGRKMKLWKFWDNDRCPCCQAPNETTQHLLICPSPGQRSVWDEAVKGFDAWMTAVDTAPDIAHCFRNALRSCSPDHPFMAYASQSIFDAATEQDNIGWFNFMEGRISRQWGIAQAEHYASRGSQRTANRWTEELIQNLYSVVHKMWKSRNDIVHARNDKGIKLTEAREIEIAIEREFAQGPEGLRPEDRHLLRRGKRKVHRMPACEQRTWLHSMEVARHVASVEESDETTRQRDLMDSWLRPDVQDDSLTTD